MTTGAINTYSTSVGKKAVMAITGLFLASFVVIHMLGNLQVFGGPEKMNAYAAFLRSIPAPLWGIRAILALAALLHVLTALQLMIQDLKSRPVHYVKRRYHRANYASRTMIFTGPLILAYLVYHLLHQTFGTVLPGFDAHDVYRNVVSGFSTTSASVVYIVTMALLGLHIKHGIWSLFQTLGLNIPRYDRLLRAVSLLLALALVAGFISVPVAVLTGHVR